MSALLVITYQVVSFSNRLTTRGMKAVSQLTDSWPSCAPVECESQSHVGLYQSIHFLFHI